MKRLIILTSLFVVALLVTSAFAINTTWRKTLPSAAYGHLGENQKMEMIKAVETEIRNRINGIATFVGYTSAE